MHATSCRKLKNRNQYTFLFKMRSVGYSLTAVIPLLVAVCPAAELEIHYSDPSGQMVQGIHCAELQADATVSQLYDVIDQQTGRRWFFKLQFAGQEAESGSQTLADLGVAMEAMIEVVPELTTAQELFLFAHDFEVGVELECLPLYLLCFAVKHVLYHHLGRRYHSLVSRGCRLLCDSPGCRLRGD